MAETDQRIRALEDRVTLLEDALGMNYHAPPAWGLTPCEAAIFGVIMRVPMATFDRLMTAVYAHKSDPPDANVIKVHVHRIRRKIAPYGLTINTAKCVGYWIPEEQKAKLSA